MKKDFDKWNIEKKTLNSNEGYSPFYRERQIRWCKLGVNVGFEQDGTGGEFSRPVLVLKGFNRSVCLVVPLTTSTKDNLYNIPIGEIDGKNASVIISQIRLIDTKRLYKHIGTLDKITFQKIKNTIKKMF